MTAKDKKQMLHGVLLTIMAAGLIAAAGLITAGLPAQRQLPGSSPAPTYVLKDYGGYLAIFPYNSNIPQKVLQVKIDSLPVYDAQELKTGVYATDKEELNRLLEDYDA